LPPPSASPKIRAGHGSEVIERQRRGRRPLTFKPDQFKKGQ
jgi:hypothetical protein